MLVVDRVDVIRALVALLLEIDPPGKRLASPVRSFKLKHATASEVARVVSETLGIAAPEVVGPVNPLAQLVDLKFFCGYSLIEIAAMRGISERTAQRDWDKARMLLKQALEDGSILPG